MVMTKPFTITIKKVAALALTLYLAVTAVIAVPAFAENHTELVFDARRYINSAVNKTHPTRLTLLPVENETEEDEETARRKVGGLYRINHAEKGPMPPKYDIRGVLAVRDENGEFKPANEDQIAEGENFYLFSENEKGVYIVSSGRKENDGSLLLTGTERKGGDDTRALEMGVASLFDAFAGVSGALGGDGLAESARETAEDIRAYSAPKLPKHIAYEYNKEQKPFDILNPRDLKNFVLSLIPFGIVGGIIGAIIGFVYVIKNTSKRDLTDVIIRFGGRGGLIGILLAIVIKFFA